MKSNIENFLNKLRLYYTGASKNSLKYSNYYVLGYRNNFVFLRATGIVDSLSRIQSFIQLSQLKNSTFWFISLSSHYMWLSAKFAWITGQPFAAYTRWKSDFLIFNKDLAFMIPDDQFFFRNLLHFVGIDVGIVLHPGQDAKHPLLGYFKNKGNVLIGFDRSMGEADLYTYTLPLYLNEQSDELFYFFCRILIHFVGLKKDRFMIDKSVHSKFLI